MKFTPIAEEAGGAQAGMRRNGNKENGNNAAHMNPMNPMMTPMVAAHAAHAAMSAAMSAQSGYQPMPLMRRISGADIAASGLALPPNVIRLPRGPEKGRGFQRWCNKRMHTNPAPPPAPVVPQEAAGPNTPAQQRLRKPGSRAVPIVAPPP